MGYGFINIYVISSVIDNISTRAKLTSLVKDVGCGGNVLVCDNISVILY